MMPLWTTTIGRVQSRCGCAFSSVGRPCVAQRVCPMPYTPASGSASQHLLEGDSLPALRRTSTAPSLDDRDAGRIVAAVFEPPQPLDQDRHDLLCPDVADDSAHVTLQSSPL